MITFRIPSPFDTKIAANYKVNERFWGLHVHLSINHISVGVRLAQVSCSLKRVATGENGE